MKPKPSPALASALREIDRELRARVGTRLRMVRLFGSWARGEATEDSDIDVAVVIDRLEAPDREIIFDVVHRAERASDLVLSLFLVSGERFDTLAQGSGGIASAILEEGIAP